MPQGYPEKALGSQRISSNTTIDIYLVCILEFQSTHECKHIIVAYTYSGHTMVVFGGRIILIVLAFAGALAGQSDMVESQSCERYQLTAE